MRSVLAQTYGDIEYIVVDGGSVDDSQAIAASDPRVRVVSVPGSSQAQAINAGFALASGEFFAFLNADDALEPEAIADGVRLLARGNAPFAYGAGTFVADDGSEIGDYPVLDATPEALERECCVCQPATLIRAAAFERVGGIDERYDMAFDYDLWFRLMSDSPAPVRSAKRWARARMHVASKTSRGPKKMYTEVVRLLRRHRGYVPFSWAHAYADFVIRRRDQFFDPPSGSPLRTILTLVLGLAYNPGHPVRFTRDFVKETTRLRKKRRSA